MKSEREQKRELQELAHRYGAAVDFLPTRKGHIKVVFQHATKQSAVVMARGHGGDVRGKPNNIARAKRQLRELTGRQM